MNILVISQYYYPEPFKIHEICKGLVDRGNKVTVITEKPNYPNGIIYEGYENTEYESIDGVSVIRVNARPRGINKVDLLMSYLDYPIKTWNYLKKVDNRFDLIYCYQLSPVFMLWPAIKMKKKHNIPLCCYILDLWPESLNAIGIKSNSIIQKILLAPINHLYKSCNRVLVTSEGFIDYVKTINKVEQKKIHVLHQHGEELFLGIKPKTNVGEKIIITFAGNIGRVQGLDYFVDAISRVDKCYRDKLLFNIIGDGSYKKELMKKVNNLKLNDCIIFIERKQINDLYTYYSNTDIFAISLEKGNSIENTVPSKFQTYLSVGRPIIGCINGSVNKIISEEKLGVCCEAGNIDELVKNIILLLNKKNEWQEISERAKNYFLNNYTIDKHLQNLICEMEDLL